MAVKRGIEMPISAEVYAVLYAGRTPGEATQRLLERASKSELD
jgi:glycerol-3-phosphate dehydrogenase